MPILFLSKEFIIGGTWYLKNSLRNIIIEEQAMKRDGNLYKVSPSLNPNNDNTKNNEKPTKTKRVGIQTLLYL